MTYSDAAHSYYMQEDPRFDLGIGGRIQGAFDAGLAARPSLAPITTAAELDALPSGSVVRTRHGGIQQKQGLDWMLAGMQTPWPIARAFDAGPLTLLVPASAPTPEPCCDSMEYVIDSGWLCRVHNHHTCGAGGMGQHEPGCGLEPEIHLSAVDGWPAEKPKPVRLTNPADPRIRVGALVEITHSVNAKGEFITYRHRLDDEPGSCWSVDYVRKGIDNTRLTYLLIEEATDPDAELIPAITLAAITGAHKYAVGEPTWDDLDSRDLLRDFRAVDLDVVRTVKP